MFTFKTGDSIKFAGVHNPAPPAGYTLIGTIFNPQGQKVISLSVGGYITYTDTTHFIIDIPSAVTKTIPQGEYKLELALVNSTDQDVIVSKNEAGIRIVNSITGKEAE